MGVGAEACAQFGAAVAAQRLAELHVVRGASVVISIIKINEHSMRH